MRRGAQKEKGNSWERAVASLLSEWAYKDRNVLVRGLSSGALATIRGDTDLCCGDMVQVKEFSRPFPFWTECKHKKDHVYAVDLLGKVPTRPVWASWEQCVSQCPDGKLPLLIYRSNYRLPVVITRPVSFTERPDICLRPLGDDILAGIDPWGAAISLILLKHLLATPWIWTNGKPPDYS